jgi:hypothetical protein
VTDSLDGPEFSVEHDIGFDMDMDFDGGFEGDL